MPSIQEMEQALIAADQAGDTAAAQAIADDIGRMSFNQPAREGMSHTETRREPKTVQGELTDLGKGMASGAASIPISLNKGIRFINPFDSIDRQPRSEQALEEFDKENADSGAFQSGKMGAQVAGTWGTGNVLSNAVKAISPTSALLAQALESGGLGSQASLPTRMASGATVGYTADAMTGGDGGVGAGVGAALPGVQQVGGKGLGKIIDLIMGKGADVKAGKVMRDVVGDNADEVKTLWGSAPDNITAAQAAAPANSTRISALGKRAERAKSEHFNTVDDTQEANRISTLEGVKPDLMGAEAARKSASDPLYKAAREAGDVVDTTSVVNKIDSLLEENPGNKELVRELTNIKAGLVDESGNLRTNAQQIASTLDGLKAATANKENKFILGQLVEIKDDIAKSIPGYKEAQAKFSELSPPVNQSKVIQSMLDVMKNSKGGERVTPFLDVMGRGENALLKRADQSPRYGGIDDVLTPEQMAARNKVADEMMRDVKIDNLASKGSSDLSTVLEGDAAKFRFPALLNVKATVANKGLDIAESRLNKKTMDKVYEAMKSGKTAKEAMDFLPADERVKVINAIMKSKLPMTPAAAVYGSQGE